ncbi:MAG: T9SS type A sorting domain-containing protein [Bacteroidetes bacterium]|nr:T9SS type A sorting domain-containing protein [Bacteroidota bacterium]
MQFHGAMKEGLAGSLRNWWVDAGASSIFRSNSYFAVARDTDSLVIASGAKVINPELPGGNVFYLGGHDYYHTTDITKMNALRLYLNAVFVPAYPNSTCELFVLPNSISGNVFKDVDQDSTLSAADSAMISIRVNLYIDVNRDGKVDAGDVILETILTDSLGKFNFNVGILGMFVMDIEMDDLPAGYGMTTDNLERAVFTEMGQTDPDNDFGAYWAVLPIELIDFTAKPVQSYVDIHWETASELNNDYFTIERSGNGTDFEWLVDINGAGNSWSNLEYYYTDVNPLSGTSYYRLKQTDFNGVFEYFPMVSVTLNTITKEIFEVFPNPCYSDKFYIRFNEEKETSFLVTLYDVYGKEIFSRIIPVENYGESVKAIDLDERLAPGIYLVIGSTEDKLYKQKLIIGDGRM